MKRLISTLTVVALVLVNLSSCAKADTDQVISLFPEVVTEAQDIFFGKLTHVEAIGGDVTQEGVYNWVTYNFVFRVYEVIRGKLSPGEYMAIAFDITPDMALGLGRPYEDGLLINGGTISYAYNGNYLVLNAPKATSAFCQFFKIERDDMLVNFFPDYEALIREAQNSEPEPGEPSGLRLAAVPGYRLMQKMKDSCPKTVDEARVTIRTALHAARLQAVGSALWTGATILLVVAVPALLLTLHLIRRKRNK